MRSTALTPLNIAAAIPTPYVDYFLWPAIAGEPFPPALGATGIYSSAGDSPAYRAGAGAAPGRITFPILPRISPPQQVAGTVAISARMWGTNGAAGSYTVLGILAGGVLTEYSVGFHDNTGDLIIDLNGPTMTFPALRAEQEYQKTKLSFSPSGILTITLDDVTIYESAAGFEDLAGQTIQPFIDTNQVGNPGITKTLVEWL